ncbi:DUF2161 family putative PD-(D/E)XK-type phosphodiesterase [Solidesulfovibrio fructosivorans]|nr:DUF2161 family putative PD-(D/E)XK-type phosphodiesterase [Solidesulfovibrio fructosivorans]
MKESDLYLPLKRFLESQGYEVKSEIGACDVVAVRGEEMPLVVELKLSFNIDVMLQAVDRLALTQKVYVGILENNKTARKRQRRLLKLLKMLGLGFLQISPDQDKGRVTVLLDPGEYRPRKSNFRQERLLGEFVRRVGDPNLGGSVRNRGIVTVYRQRAVAIAQYIQQNGPSKASSVSQALQDPNAHSIVYKDVYGWFERISRGVYALSPRGEGELPGWLEKTMLSGAGKP